MKTALERIKEIENEYMKGSGLIEDEEMEFLLGAFKVMREIALENTISFSWAPSKRPVDKTFEERMDLK